MHIYIYIYWMAYRVKEIKYRRRWWSAATSSRWDRFDLGDVSRSFALLSLQTSPANYFGYSRAYAWMSIGHHASSCQSVIARVYNGNVMQKAELSQINRNEGPRGQFTRKLGTERLEIATMSRSCVCVYMCMCACDGAFFPSKNYFGIFSFFPARAIYFVNTCVCEIASIY